MLKFPHFKQADQKDCGPTCLKIIAKYYGKSIHTAPLRDYAETTREGSSLLGLSEAAEKIGFHTCHKATYDEVQTIRRAKPKEGGGFEYYDVDKIISTAAWYTPEIPLSNGPGKYGGLPGLILEVGNDFDPRTMVCTEIELNPEKKVNVKKPKRGKVVSEKEYLAEIEKAKGRRK